TFVIERGQVLNRTPAPCHDNHIHSSTLIEVPNPSRHFNWRLQSLHLCRKDQHTRGLVPPLQNIQDIAQRRRLRRCHNSNPSRQGRNRLLTRFIKQPFCLQLRLQLFEGNLQRSRPFRFQVLSRNLQLTAILINRHAPARHHLHSILWAKPQQPRRRTKHH